MGESQIVPEQVPTGMEGNVEERIFPTQSGRRNRAHGSGTGTLPDSVQCLDRKQLKIGVPQLKVKLDPAWNSRIEVVAFPFPARFLNQWRQMVCSQLAG